MKAPSISNVSKTSWSKVMLEGTVDLKTTQTHLQMRNNIFIYTYTLFSLYFETHVGSFLSDPMRLRISWRTCLSVNLLLLIYPLFSCVATKSMNETFLSSHLVPHRTVCQQQVKISSSRFPRGRTPSLPACLSRSSRLSWSASKLERASTSPSICDTSPDS